MIRPSMWGTEDPRRLIWHASWVPQPLVALLGRQDWECINYSAVKNHSTRGGLSKQRLLFYRFIFRLFSVWFLFLCFFLLFRFPFILYYFSLLRALALLCQPLLNQPWDEFYWPLKGGIWPLPDAATAPYALRAIGK